MTAKMMPLSGVRVLDMGRMFAAPMTGQMLADLGADVIKVERLDGDEIRLYGPPYLKDTEGRELRESAYSLSANRGKRSIAVDLSKPEGCDLVRRLAMASDVLIENFKVGDLARRGLCHESLRALKPSLIYCSVTGFGQTGPYAKLPGVDTAFQAMSGLMSITGEPDGEPQKVGFTMADVVTGLYGVISVLAALRHREVNHGPGQQIDMALLDSAVAVMSHRTMEHFMTGKAPKRVGTGSSGNVPARTFQCSAGIISVQAGGEGQFKNLCRVIGRPDLPQDPRFSNRRLRGANEKELLLILDAIFITRTAQEWFALLGSEGVYCGPVYTVPEVFEDPQVKHRGLRQTVKHPQAGEISLIANPIRFSETPIDEDRAPPMTGAHTDEILKEVLNLSEDEIAALRTAGVIGMGTTQYAP